MTKDELYPVIDEVLHKRWHPWGNAGGAWIEHWDGDIQLRIHPLAEALCDALCKAVGDLTAERDASRLMISDLTAEIVRLRDERDAYRQAVDALAAWEEARRD